MARPGSPGGLRLIAVDAVPPQPWRNGGGVTREVLAWPPGPDWQMRISVANIDADGPFSFMAGIDRWFAVVQGQGVVLRMADHDHAAPALVLDEQSQPTRFRAEQAPFCSLQGGATRDLNLMSRRDAGASHMLRAAEGDEWLSSAPWRAVFTTAPMLLQIDDADAARLPAWSLAFSDHAHRQRWRAWPLGDAVQAWWLDFQPHAQP